MTPAEEAEAQYNKLHPPSTMPTSNAPATVPATNAAPTTPIDDAEAQYQKLHPPPAPSDTDVTSQGYAPWNLPSNISQGDYWGAEGRKIGGEVVRDAANVGTVFADDMGFGLPGFIPGVGGDYRTRVEAARNDMPWAARTGVDAMAFLANKPFQAIKLGYRGAQAAGAGIKAVAPNLSADAVKAITRRVGSFVEGAGYGGAQSAGHGDDPTTVAENAAGSGIIGAGLDEVYGAAKEVAPWLRSKIYGTPEGTPAEIAAGPPPGAPPRTAEQMADAAQMNLWRSQSKLTSPPSQDAVRNYVTKVYGEDPAQWPEGLRDIHKAAGKEGTVSPLTRTAGQVASQVGAATANYLGLGLSPEVAASLHIAAPIATEAVLPKLPFTSSSPTPGAIRNAYPALTGWRPEMTMPDWRY